MYNDKNLINYKISSKGSLSTGSFPSSCRKEKIYYKSFTPENAADRRIVFVHDLFDHHGRYTNIVEELNGRLSWPFSFSFIDLKGHGLSSGVRSSVNSFHELSSDLNYFLTEVIKDEKIILIGHGLGALVVLDLFQNFAQTFSEKVIGVVLTNPLIKIKKELPNINSVLRKMPSIEATKKIHVPFYFSGKELTQCEVKALSYDSDPLVNHFMSYSFFCELLTKAKELRQASYFIDFKTLLLLSWKDPICDHDMTSLFARGADKEIFTVKEFGEFKHDLFNDLHNEKVFDAIADWVKKL